MIRTLNEVPAGLSVLARIQWLVFTMFNEGQYPASIIFNSMRATVLDYETEGSKISVDVSGGRSNTQFGLAMELQQWKSCELVSTLILLLAAPRRRESLLSALKFQSRALSGLPTLYATRTTPSASFQSTSHKAKEAALKDGKTTVLSVTLTDVHIFELAQRGLAEHCLSFAHTFTIGIGPDAVIVWQAWGKHGYSLDEYIRDGHARVRDLEEAEQFVKDFEKLASLKGTWTAKINKLYKKLFLVDINGICGSNGPGRPVTPKFKAWVRIHVIEDVKHEDVTKFEWFET